MSQDCFGLLVYNGTDNLGDEIQSLAARQFLPKVDYFFDRDALHLTEMKSGTNLRMILNGWFLKDHGVWPPPSSVEPLITAFHISPGAARTILSPQGRDYIKRFEPIGCRDRDTLKILQRAGVDSYFSGCLTLTLKSRQGERDDNLIVMNDVSPAVMNFVRGHTDKRIMVTRHAGYTASKYSDRFADAEKLLDTYAGAACVVTSRLHCALPCVAIGTPVLLIDVAPDRNRFSGLEDFCHHVSEASLLSGSFDYSFVEPPPNPTRHVPYRNGLIKDVEAYLVGKPRDSTSLHRAAIVREGSADKNILFVQTAEANYRPLLDVTSRTVIEYCSRNQYQYEMFFGIVRGFHSWQATCNRIGLLKRLIDTGYKGWVCYLDADAFVADLDFDLKAFLEDKADIAIIAAYGTPTSPWWDVNAGVFLINLSHDVGRSIVTGWFNRFEQISDDDLLSATNWHQAYDDQKMLHSVLQEVGAEQHTLIRNDILNYETGKFIKQFLRVLGDLKTRIAYLKRAVHDVLPSESLSIECGQTNDEVVDAFYRVLLLREPDPQGHANGKKILTAEGIEHAMRSCLSSEEFAAKFRQFSSTYVRDKV